MSNPVSGRGNQGDQQPLFPGGIGLSRLRVYPWDTDDGLHGGSPHLHLTCTECYCVLGGTGELHTLTAEGLRKVALRAGDAVWFTPGTIHRAVNTGDLRVQVVMQNDGLPEAGDAVMTFPPEHLASPEAYAAVASLGDGDFVEREERARKRRDLAIAGFTELVEGGLPALERFYAAAVALVAGRLDVWEAAWREKALAAAERTGEQIEALRRGDGGYLRDATVARLAAPAESAFGMCGYLAPYPRDRAESLLRNRGIPGRSESSNPPSEGTRSWGRGSAKEKREQRTQGSPGHKIGWAGSQTNTEGLEG